MPGYLALLLVASLVPAGQTAIILEQKAISIMRNIKGSATLICEILSPTFDNIHWYRHQEGKAPERLLRYSMLKSESVLDPGFSSEKVRAYKGKDNICKLILSDLQLSDSGTYYCASWDGRAKVFGEGTKLIVTSSNIPKKPPNPIFFLPTSEEINSKKSGTYICLLEDFFPGVIKTYWKENDNSHPLDAQVGPVTRVNNLYSQISWVTVSEDTLKKNLSYFYQHEGFDAGQGAKEIPVPSIAKESIKNNCENTEAKTKVFQEMHFANMSAFYTYSILLVKSTIYFAIILFFLYQKKATGSQGKK
ncbi:T-cell receptor gamma alternate reading frame protein [Macrotis lagotis]|uniref:T-cell receptor gamma alternate reading frame protein n=1 Tax=Macrotis lagotis TaxID=92651 RepID=UPI003D68CF26